MANRSISGMLNGGWSALAFEPFREGIEIHHLERGSDGEPSVALLRYAPGASAPLHVHDGLETILVLEGAQSDQNGTYEKGDWVVNPVGSRHTVWSDSGCVILIQWDRPVRFIDGDGE